MAILGAVISGAALGVWALAWVCAAAMAWSGER
jgi:hypothetical protein